jgi:hypothetical protein
LIEAKKSALEANKYANKKGGHRRKSAISAEVVNDQSADDNEVHEKERRGTTVEKERGGTAVEKENNQGGVKQVEKDQGIPKKANEQEKDQRWLKLEEDIFVSFLLAQR